MKYEPLNRPPFGGVFVNKIDHSLRSSNVCTTSQDILNIYSVFQLICEVFTWHITISIWAPARQFFQLNRTTRDGAKQARMRTTRAQRALQIGGSHLIPLPAMWPKCMLFYDVSVFIALKEVNSLVPTFELLATGKVAIITTIYIQGTSISAYLGGKGRDVYVFQHYH